MSPASKAPSVAILAMPETTASVVYGMYDLFMSAGRDWGVIVNGAPGPALIEAAVVAAQDAPFMAPNGVTIAPHASIRDCRAPDIVCVPEVMIMPGEPLDGRFENEIEWLRTCYADGATLATACSGAVLLAEAGLLDGHEATTHWAYCESLRSRYPQVKVCPERALVVSGEGHRLVMAGGGTSWLDLALYLIARSVGVEAAMQVAKINLIDWHAIGQQPFARLARSRQVDDAVIARCQTWIADHYREPAPVSRDGAVIRHRRALVQAAFSTSYGDAAARIRAYPAFGRSQADARVRRCADRGNRQRSGLRGCGILQPAVPAQRESDAGTVSQALRLAAAGAAGSVVEHAACRLTGVNFLLRRFDPHAHYRPP